MHKTNKQQKKKPRCARKYKLKHPKLRHEGTLHPKQNSSPLKPSGDHSKLQFWSFQSQGIPSCHPCQKRQHKSGQECLESESSGMQERGPNTPTPEEGVPSVKSARPRWEQQLRGIPKGSWNQTSTDLHTSSSCSLCRELSPNYSCESLTAGTCCPRNASQGSVH